MITQNIIGLELSSLSDKKIQAFNPSTKEFLPEEFVTATNEEVDLALQKATQAWRIFRKIDPVQKAFFLSSIADGMEALGDILVQRMMQETGYSEARVLVERKRTCSQLRMYAEILSTDDFKDLIHIPAIPDRSPAPRPDLRKMNFALGPVVVFAASNFPLAYSTAGGDTVSALAAGCPVIIKAHESHLGTNALVAEIIQHAARSTSMPDGVFSSLNGEGIETGKALVLHPLTAAVGFTGSLTGGRALFDLGNSRQKPIPVFAEMGSTNPVFLMPGSLTSNQEKIVRMLVDSITGSAGQFCTKPGILVAIWNEQTNLFLKLLQDEILKIPAFTMLNQNISNHYAKGIRGIENVKDISIISAYRQQDNISGLPVLATINADIFISNPILHQEVFGPYALCVLCRDQDQMTDVAASLEGQLTATIHASTEEEIIFSRKLTEILIEKAGRIIFNGVPTGVEVCEAMTHGGPYPASTDVRFTAVGHHAIRRWLRPVTYQNFPNELLPEELK